MKKYYIKYPRNFNNEYNLYSVESEQDEMAIEKIGDCERITLKQALQKISEEKEARKYNPSFSNFGSTYIVPASIAIDADKLHQYDEDRINYYNQNHTYKGFDC